MSNILADAIALASEAHVDQLDKGGHPYILHPLAVMHKVRTFGLSIVDQASSVCHDVKEDCPAYDQRLKDIAVKYGEIRFYWLIHNLSRFEGETYDEFIDRIIASEDEGLIIIKMCDIEHNSCITRLKGVGDKDFNRMKKYHRSFLKLQKALEDLRGRVRQNA